MATQSWPTLAVLKKPQVKKPLVRPEGHTRLQALLPMSPKVVSEDSSSDSDSDGEELTLETRERRKRLRERLQAVSHMVIVLGNQEMRSLSHLLADQPPGQRSPDLTARLASWLMKKTPWLVQRLRMCANGGDADADDEQGLLLQLSAQVRADPLTSTQILFDRGAEADGVYIVMVGSIACYYQPMGTSKPRTREQMKKRFCGFRVGEKCLYTGCYQPGEAVAELDCFSLEPKFPVTAVAQETSDLAKSKVSPETEETFQGVDPNDALVSRTVCLCIPRDVYARMCVHTKTTPRFPKAFKTPDNLERTGGRAPKAPTSTAFERVELFKRMKLFRGRGGDAQSAWKRDALFVLAESCTDVHFRAKGSAIFHEGEETYRQGIYIVMDGTIALCTDCSRMTVHDGTLPIKGQPRGSRGQRGHSNGDDTNTTMLDVFLAVRGAVVGDIGLLVDWSHVKSRRSGKSTERDPSDPLQLGFAKVSQFEKTSIRSAVIARARDHGVHALKVDPVKFRALTGSLDPVCATATAANLVQMLEEWSNWFKVRKDMYCRGLTHQSRVACHGWSVREAVRSALCDPKLNQLAKRTFSAKRQLQSHEDIDVAKLITVPSIGEPESSTEGQDEPEKIAAAERLKLAFAARRKRKDKVEANATKRPANSPGSSASTPPPMSTLTQNRSVSSVSSPAGSTQHPAARKVLIEPYELWTHMLPELKRPQRSEATVEESPAEETARQEAVLDTLRNLLEQAGDGVEAKDRSQDEQSVFLRKALIRKIADKAILVERARVLHPLSLKLQAEALPCAYCGHLNCYSLRARCRINIQDDLTHRTVRNEAQSRIADTPSNPKLCCFESFFDMIAFMHRGSDPRTPLSRGGGGTTPPEANRPLSRGTRGQTPEESGRLWKDSSQSIRGDSDLFVTNPTYVPLERPVLPIKSKSRRRKKKKRKKSRKPSPQSEQLPSLSRAAQHLERSLYPRATDQLDAYNRLRRLANVKKYVKVMPSGIAINRDGAAVKSTVGSILTVTRPKKEELARATQKRDILRRGASVDSSMPFWRSARHILKEEREQIQELMRLRRWRRRQQRLDNQNLANLSSHFDGKPNNVVAKIAAELNAAVNSDIPSRYSQTDSSDISSL